MKSRAGRRQWGWGGGSGWGGAGRPGVGGAGGAAGSGAGEAATNSCVERYREQTDTFIDWSAAVNHPSSQPRSRAAVRWNPQFRWGGGGVVPGGTPGSHCFRDRDDCIHDG